MPLPLSGITVVAFEQAVAAPLCSRHLGDLGARIIKVENPSGGDFTRHYDDAVRGFAAHFVWLNRNKESVTLDLKSPASVPILEALLGRADVVIQNLAPGAAARMGIASAQIVARFPRAVAVDMSGYGIGGPLDDKRAYDLLVQAEAGACSITGLPGAPAKAGPPLADVGSAMYALSGILAALFERERTDVGTALRIGMFDVVAEWVGFALQFTMHTGEERPPNGMSTPMVAPYGAYSTQDGVTVVLGTTNDNEWQRLARGVIERPDMADDVRFATNALRCRERTEIDEAIEAWTSQKNLVDIQRMADAAGIGNARYNTIGDVIGHRQLLDRNRWREVQSSVGPLATLMAPYDVDTWEARTDPIPDLGADTDRVLSELGFSRAQVDQLRTDGTV